MIQHRWNKNQWR